jgi:predicted flap endonuclease-1-like 5' DNA nuclease
MSSQPQSTGPLGSAEQMMPLTITHLILIAIFAVAMVAVIVWGMRLRRKRHEAREALEERGEVQYVAPGQALPEQPSDAAPAARKQPEADPVAEPPAPSAAPRDEAPIAHDVRDEPIAAAAAFEASPALEAADASSADAEPEPVPAPPPAPAPGPASDDLTQLKGLGPRVAERLRANGIHSIADLAALSDAEAEALDAKLENFRGRMVRDRWIEQARLLHAGDRAGYEAQFGKL